MENKRVANLVIFSTLNQITNYLVIKKFNPEKIFNITYGGDLEESFNTSIKPSDWDKNLSNYINCGEVHNIALKISENLLQSQFQRIIDEQIIGKLKENESVFWHVTGGQRILALYIQDFLIKKNRANDRIIFLEGNSNSIFSLPEALIEFSTDCFDNQLNFEMAFNLMGFDTKEDLKSTCRYIPEMDDKSLSIKVSRYYRVYKEMLNCEKLKIASEMAEYTFRELLIKSNSIKNGERINYLKESIQAFIESLKLDTESKNALRNELESNLTYEYPAGYIYEKLFAAAIYYTVKEESSVVDMRTSIKVYSEAKTEIVDEIDIALLMNSGKILNFECKSGSMSGDNAKSHKYTTYKLSGIYGCPILLSPLNVSEYDSNDSDYLSNVKSSIRAGRKAGLDIIFFDQVESKIKKMAVL